MEVAPYFLCSDPSIPATAIAFANGKSSVSFDPCMHIQFLVKVRQIVQMRQEDPEQQNNLDRIATRQSHAFSCLLVVVLLKEKEGHHYSHQG